MLLKAAKENVIGFGKSNCRKNLGTKESVYSAKLTLQKESDL
jgi:hypothetical protein